MSIYHNRTAGVCQQKNELKASNKKTTSKELRTVVDAFLLMENAALDKSLSKVAYRVLTRLLGHYHYKEDKDHGRCNPSYETLSKSLGTSARNVRAGIACLKETGWLTAEQTYFQASNCYEFAWDRAVELKLEGNKSKRRQGKGVIRNDHQGVTHSDYQGDTHDDHQGVTHDDHKHLEGEHLEVEHLEKEHTLPGLEVAKSDRECCASHSRFAASSTSAEDDLINTTTEILAPNPQAPLPITFISQNHSDDQASDAAANSPDAADGDDDDKPDFFRGLSGLEEFALLSNMVSYDNTNDKPDFFASLRKL